VTKPEACSTTQYRRKVPTNHITQCPKLRNVKLYSKGRYLPTISQWPNLRTVALYSIESRYLPTTLHNVKTLGLIALYSIKGRYLPTTLHNVKTLGLIALYSIEGRYLPTTKHSVQTCTVWKAGSCQSHHIVSKPEDCSIVQYRRQVPTIKQHPNLKTVTVYNMEGRYLPTTSCSVQTWRL